MKFLLRSFFWVLVIIVSISWKGVLAQPRLFRDMNKHLEQKPKLSFSFDSRNTFIVGQNANIFGLRAGLDFNGRVRIGIGLQGLTTPIPRLLIFPPDSVGLPPDTAFTQIGFTYFTLYTEYAFYKSKRWEFGIPFYLGIGNASYREGSYEFNKSAISLIESSLYGQFYIFSWLALHSGAGYRLMLKSNPAISGRFSGPVYTLGVKVYFGKMYRSVFPKKK
jgi:hypothetical protein